MTSTLMDAKSAASNLIAHHGRINLITGVLLNLFTLSVIVSSVLAVLKLTGAVAITWLIVALPVLISVGFATILLVFSGIVASVATARGKR